MREQNAVDITVGSPETLKPLFVQDEEISFGGGEMVFHKTEKGENAKTTFSLPEMGSNMGPFMVPSPDENAMAVGWTCNILDY